MWWCSALINWKIGKKNFHTECNPKKFDLPCVLTYNAETTVIQETTKLPTEALHKGIGLLAEHQLQEMKLDVSCSFILDNIQKFINAWKEITTDKVILEIAKKSFKIYFVSDSKNYFISNIP